MATRQAYSSCTIVALLASHAVRRGGGVYGDVECFLERCPIDHDGGAMTPASTAYGMRCCSMLFFNGNGVFLSDTRHLDSDGVEQEQAREKKKEN
jgi:hypothetical protein